MNNDVIAKLNYENPLLKKSERNNTKENNSETSPKPLSNNIAAALYNIQPISSKSLQVNINKKDAPETDMSFISKPEIKTAVKVYERSELKGSDWKFIVILILISNTYNLIKAKISKKKIKIIIQGISIFSTFCYTTFYLLSIIYNKNITEVYYYVINNLLAIVGIMVLICCIIQTYCVYKEIFMSEYFTITNIWVKCMYYTMLIFMVVLLCMKKHFLLGTIYILNVMTTSFMVTLWLTSSIIIIPCMILEIIIEFIIRLVTRKLECPHRIKVSVNYNPPPPPPRPMMNTDS